MIFRPDMIGLVLDGRKTQTRRRVKLSGDLPLPCFYRPGVTYGVQPGRGQPAVGRIRVLAVHHEPVTAITPAGARAEGFPTVQAFLDRWVDLHGSTDGDAWVITIEPA